MKRRANFLGLIALVSILASMMAAPVAAQNPQPAVPPPGPAGPASGPGSSWSRYLAEQRLRLQKPVQAAPSASGSDLFGYVMDTSAAYSWIEAKSGKAVSFTEMYGYSKAVALPFTFKFYENAYNSFYINENGYLAFQNGWADTAGVILSPESPNDVIAPWWTWLSTATSGTSNRVYTKLFGSAPNRYIVVEWYQVQHAYDTNLKFTFEAILYENGNIGFQYYSIGSSNTGYCASAGIEDSSGYDGLASYESCGWMENFNNSVRFTRPAAGARLNVYPRTLGGTLTTSGQLEQPLSIRNTGELGADTYDLVVTTNPGWQVNVYAQNQSLADSNGNGKVDTGSLAAGQTLILDAVITHTATIANVGDANLVTLTFASARNPARSAGVQIQASIPPAFGQVYQDDVNNGAVSLDMLGSAGTRTVKTSSDNSPKYSHVATTAPNGNLLMAWTKDVCTGSPCMYSYSQIEYTVNDSSGASLRTVTKLADLTTSGNIADIQDLSAAAAPNGRIGLAWYQNLYNNQDKHLCNVYSAIVDANGSLIAGPINLTNQTGWVSWNDNNITCFYDVGLTASSDNRFITTYQKEFYTSNGTTDDIFTTIQDSSGTLVQGPVQRTVDTVGWEKGYSSPGLIALANNQALITFMAYPENDLMGVVVNSAGEVVRNIFNLTNNGDAAYEWGADGVLLPNGKILIGWWEDGAVYALFDPAQNYQIVAGPTHLANPQPSNFLYSVSVTSDAASHGILSWDTDHLGCSPNLWYAVANGDGTLLLNTTILRSANLQNGTQYIATGSSGGGNTTLVEPAANQGVDLYASALPLTLGVPNGNSSLWINLGNLGLTSTTGTLTVDLGPELGFAGASQAPASVVGHVVTWDLSRMDARAAGRLYLTISLPGGAANGTLYPLQISIQSTAGSDLAPANNTLTVQVMAVDHQVFLPFVNR